MMGRVRSAVAALTAGPDWPADEGDRATVDVLGLRLPVRATVAIGVVTMALLLDYSRTLLPADLLAAGRAPAAMLAISLERAVLFGLVPLLTVVVVGLVLGISRKEVTPPLAQAREAVWRSSLCVSPGSRKWT